MSEHVGAFPEPGSTGWMRVLGHPDVDRLDVADGTVRVRLHSGIELEWPQSAGADGDRPPV